MAAANSRKEDTMHTFYGKTFFSLLCLLLLSASAVCAMPANHAALMSDSEYKEAFEGYSATLQEAKERLNAQEFAALEKGAQEEMAASVKEDMDMGETEAAAWVTAYAVGCGRVNRELRWDWLRRNPEGIQGFYRIKSDAFDGWLAVEKGDEENLYAVEIYAIQKQEPYNSGELEGFGLLKGDTLEAVDKNNDECPVHITFKGDTASITESGAFKESGWLGAGVSFDADYTREKK